MKKLFCVLYITVFMFWGIPSFAADLLTYNYLQGVETSSSENEIKIVLNFSKPIKNVLEPQFFEKSIQFTFDKTYVKPAKKTFNIGEELIPDIHLYQYDKNRVRLRMVIGKGDIPYKDILTYEEKGNQLLISVSKKSISLLDNMYDESSTLPTVDVEEYYNKPIELSSETKYQKDLTPIIYDEADESKISLDVNKGESSAVSNSNTPTLFASSIKVISALMIVLSLMLVIYYFVKKYLLKDGSLLGLDKQIKVLSTNYIAPKKSISLVEVAGEVLVLGVTATNINLLTKIEDKEIIERIKGKKQSSSANWKKNKRIKSSFPKYLDTFTSKIEETKKKDSSVKLINRLIEEKINKVKTV